MLSSYQEGRRARPNAGASLLGNGHLSPLGRHPQAGAVQYAHRPGPTSRSGPAPASARQIAAHNARQSQTKRAVDQLYVECQRAIQDSNARIARQAASLSLTRLEAHRPERHGNGQNVEIAIPGTFTTVDALRYREGNLWIYTTALGNSFQDHVYYVYNPETKVILEFKPAGASREAQFKNIAAHTGRVGGYIEKTYLATALGAVGLAAAVEVGGYYLITEEAMPFLSRVAVRGLKVGRPLAQAAFDRARDGFFVRAGTDLGTQLGAGFIMNKGSVWERAKLAAYGVNITSVFIAGVVNTEGLNLGKLAKWLVPAGSAAVSNGFSGSFENIEKHKSYFHLVDLSNGQEAAKYAFNIILGTLLDKGRDGLVEKGAKKAAARIAHASGKTEGVALRYVKITKMTLYPNLGLATGFESGKKRLEQRWESHNEEVKKEEAARLAKANGRKTTTPHTSRH